MFQLVCVPSGALSFEGNRVGGLSFLLLEPQHALLATMACRTFPLSRSKYRTTVAHTNPGGRISLGPLTLARPGKMGATDFDPIGPRESYH